MVDTSGIHSLIGRARSRLRIQAGLEAATTSTVIAAVVVMAAVYVTRRGWVSETMGIALMAGALIGVLIAAVVAAGRRLPDAFVATRIDRASGLADRLANACAFEKRLAEKKSGDPETQAMMRAAIADAVRAVPKADVKGATPYRRPTDARAAAWFGAVAIAVAGLYFADDSKKTFEVTGKVTLAGAELPDVSPEAERKLQQLDSAADSEDQSASPRGKILLQHLRTGKVTEIPLKSRGPLRFDLELDSGHYDVRFEANPALCIVDPESKMKCVGGKIDSGVALVQRRERKSKTTELRCTEDACTLDIDIPKRLGLGDDGDNVAFNDDDLDYVQGLLDDLKKSAKDAKDADLKAFVKAVEDLLAKAKQGELTKEQLLDKLAKAEEKYMQGSEDNLKQHMKDLAKTGKELKKNKTTRDLGKALEKGDLDKAKKEMEKLAKQLENNEISKKDREKVAKALEKAAKQFEKADQKRDKKLANRIKNTKQAIDKLKRRMDNAKNDREKRMLSRRMKDQQRRLKQLQRKKQQRNKSANRRRLQRLHRNMQKAAQNMRQQNNQKSRRQASRRFKDMARDTGKVSNDRRKIRNQKKVATQLSDLKEAMRRARQRRGRGPKDMFGRNRRNRDFGRRARGRQGRRQAWRPGQGQGNKPGQGKGKGGKKWGTGSDPNLLGPETAKSGNTTDKSVSGVHGRKGQSTRETVLAAAQKGFASQAYKKVYARYKTIVEDVMQVEKVPSGYKYYIKRYFQKIKPHSMD